MPVTHTSRSGKVYYLHTGRRRGGGTQHFFSTKSAGSLAQCLPQGFEVYETVNGQVYLRRRQPPLIRDDERACLARQLEEPRGGHRYKLEVRGKVLTVYESTNDFAWLAEIAPHLSQHERDVDTERFAHYQPVLRFVLAEAEQRLFSPERYCFRGSVDDWISIGPPDGMEKLTAKYLRHLGQDSIYELY